MSKRNKYMREYYLKNKEKMLKQRQDKFNERRFDHYIIYYLPNEHYCGHTNHPDRFQQHKNKGKDITNWQVLFTTKTKKEAIYYEALFCSTLGINGL